MSSTQNEDVTVGTNPGATVTSDIAQFSGKVGSMYSSVIKNFSKKSGKGLDHVQHLWDRHVKETKKKYKEDHRKFYPTVVNSLKKSLGISENDFVDKISKMLDEDIQN